MLEVKFNCFCARVHIDIRLLYFIFLCVSAAKPQPTAPESRSPSGSINKPDPGSPEKTLPRGETKPEPVSRLRATSSSSSPGGPVSPKPPVPQGAKPALAARPTIPQKPRTVSSNRSTGTGRALDLNFCYTRAFTAAIFLFVFLNHHAIQYFVQCSMM